MPRQRITKEMVVEAAFSLAREGGMEKVLVKNIAERIGCSVQPVYCYCRNMDGLRADVVEYTGKFIQEYVSCLLYTSWKRLRTTCTRATSSSMAKGLTI